MSLVEFIQSDWKSRAIAEMREKSSLPSSRTPATPRALANPSVLPSTDEATQLQAWGSAVWQELSGEAIPQQQPIAVIVDATQRTLQEAVFQSAQTWFADTGGAVLIDEERIAGLHPDEPALTISEGQSWESARRLATMLLADAITRGIHLVTKASLLDLAIAHTLLGELTRHGYQVEGIIAQSDVSKAFPRYRETRQIFQSMPQARLTFLDIEPADQDPSRAEVATSRKAGSGERPRPERRIVLGSFAEPSSAPSNLNLSALTLASRPGREQPDNQSCRIGELVAVSLSAEPGNASRTIAAAPDPSYLRRQALQENIRRRTSQEKYLDSEDA